MEEKEEEEVITEPITTHVISGPPRLVHDVAERVQRQQHVHGGEVEEVDDAVHQDVALLRVDQGRVDQRPGQRQQQVVLDQGQAAILHRWEENRGRNR